MLTAQRGGACQMAFFRFLALILIVLGLMLLGADVISMLESGQEPTLRSVENVWGLLTATGVESFKVWFAGMVPGAVMDVFNVLLALPAFAVFGVIGILLAVVFRERDEFA
jgi:cytochrome bd-type quinol oxidase subunit 2